ncbi:hypothetical protein GYMLUDRAFT_243573 [Collybiopsis luxurians FD-317 M1]|uniref:Uncharacterized protein n=1 Tax=Collybiopsis luxurians FD-317 M1 TaxID=944289 RepID=A0A0D0BCG6_9AGAR|nr:hypothetical protein GYMLUDRAFT_243573 [Collybiopsis luxurians FD-317 M1]
MTPDDQALLIDFGENIFLQALQVIIFVAGWGLFVGMSLALYLALRNSEGKPNKMMVLCLIGIFLGFTWTAAGAAGSPLDYIQLAFIKHPSKDLAAQGDLVDDKTAFWSDMSLWSETVNVRAALAIVN